VLPPSKLAVWRWEMDVNDVGVVALCWVWRLEVAVELAVPRV
jgi:hypothetical protein